MRAARGRGLAALAAASVAAVTCLCPLSAGASTGAGHPGGRLAGYRAPVAWGTCAHGIPKPFQCGTAAVPLNYKNPAGKKISLALVRLPGVQPEDPDRVLVRQLRRARRPRDH